MKKIAAFGLTLLVLTALFLPSFTQLSAASLTAPLSGGSGTVPNPLTGTSNLCVLIVQIINLVAEIGAIVAVLFLLLSGFQFIRAQGKPDKIDEAKRTFFYTLIGIAILLGAYVITQIIWGTINAIIPLPGGTCS